MKNEQNLKGQSSTEMLVTIGAIFAFTIPLLLLLFSITSYGQASTSVAQADATSRVIAESINEVYMQGDGAEKTILVNFPSGAFDLKIENNEVTLYMNTSGRFYESAAPIIPSVTTFSEPAGEFRTGLITLKIKNANKEVQVNVYQ